MMKKMLIAIILSCAVFAAPGFYETDQKFSKSIVKVMQGDSVVAHGFYIKNNQILAPKLFFNECLTDVTNCKFYIEDIDGEVKTIVSIIQLVPSRSSLPNLGQDISLIQGEVLENQLSEMQGAFLLINVKEQGAALSVQSTFVETSVEAAKLIGFLPNIPIRHEELYEIANQSIEKELAELNQKSLNLTPYLESVDELQDEAFQICLLDNEVKKQIESLKKQSAKNLVCHNYLRMTLINMEYDTQELLYTASRIKEILDSNEDSVIDFDKSLGLVETRGILTQPKVCRIYQNLPSGDMSQFPKQIAFTTDHDFVDSFIGAPLVDSNKNVIGIFYKPSVKGFNLYEENQLYGASALFISSELITKLIAD